MGEYKVIIFWWKGWQNENGWRTCQAPKKKTTKKNLRYPKSLFSLFIIDLNQVRHRTEFNMDDTDYIMVI